MGRTAIPGAVWYECNRMLDNYELQKLALQDLKTGIYDGYQGRNQTLGRERQESYIGTEEQAAIGGGGSVHHSKMDSAVEKLTGWEVTELERDIQRIDEVIKHLTPRQKQFFRLHYEEHLTIVDCGLRMSYSRDRVHTIKREVIEKTAIRLGYIR